MAIHDWTRVEPGDFHDFHQVWTVEIRNALNRGLLPPDYFAMTDQITGRPIPDVVALQIKYAQRANRVLICHGRGKVVAIIDVVSPGNKDSRHALRPFVEKAADILNQGINLFVVDLFPPTPRDPQGIHKAIWDELTDDPFELPPDKRLTVASYLGGDMPEAYVEPVAVGDALPSLPIFLNEEEYVPAPLEETYMESWKVYPALLKEIIEPPAGGA
jgi:hypothetical protein